MCVRREPPEWQYGASSIRGLRQLIALKIFAMPTTRLTLEKTVSSAGVQRDLLHAEDCSQNDVVGNNSEWCARANPMHASRSINANPMRRARVQFQRDGMVHACVALQCESNASCTMQTQRVVGGPCSSSAGAICNGSNVTCM